MFTIIYFFLNIIIKFLCRRHNTDVKKSKDDIENNIENNLKNNLENNITTKINCYICFKIINECDIYCLLDHKFCSNNCRLIYIKYNKIYL
jgi:hypothetical protein